MKKLLPFFFLSFLICHGSFGQDDITYTPCDASYEADGEFCRKIVMVRSEAKCPNGYKEFGLGPDQSTSCIYNLPIVTGPNAIRLIVSRPTNEDCGMYMPGSFSPGADDTQCACPDGYLLDQENNDCIKFFTRSGFGCEDPQASKENLSRNQYCPCPKGTLPYEVQNNSNPPTSSGTICIVPKRDRANLERDFYHCEIETADFQNYTVKRTLNNEIVNTSQDLNKLKDVLLQNGFCRSFSENFANTSRGENNSDRSPKTETQSDSNSSTPPSSSRPQATTQP